MAVSRVNDTIQEEYGIEEEDFFNFVKGKVIHWIHLYALVNLQDPEVEKAIMELQQRKLSLNPRSQEPNW